MVQSKKSKPLRNSSSTLLSMCIKCVARNMRLYENNDYFIKLPRHLKTKIIRFITRCLQEIYVPSFQILLNDAITNLNLVSFDTDDNLLLNISMKSTNIQSLYFKGTSKNLSYEGILQVSKLRLLKQLEIFNCFLVNDQFIENLATSCTSLNHLSIPGSQISDDCFNSLQKLALKNLNVSNTKISDKFLYNISKSELVDHLEELNVSNNKKVTNLGLSKLPWETLKYVAFHGCNTDETLFDVIQPATKFMMWSVPC
ncbi:uncharacterized protein LOC129612284 [Condylostylus longicornis]|uniref:uncharacterized protein LOC129612284 n=1 Tax=Condylostylus longicornis TaxID=2530218 RepID=UPI00244D9A1D|nr:uncharacterized protein LOC129612284 [Condylostylus longicornis]